MNISSQNDTLVLIILYNKTKTNNFFVVDCSYFHSTNLIYILLLLVQVPISKLNLNILLLSAHSKLNEIMIKNIILNIYLVKKYKQLCAMIYFDFFFHTKNFNFFIPLNKEDISEGSFWHRWSMIYPSK